MKVIIAGSRSIEDYNIVLNAIKDSGLHINTVVSGTATGVDKLGEKFAKYFDIPVKYFPAEWNKYGKSAGYKRNEQMAEYADALIAVWDGKSKGTKNMIDIASREGLKVFVYKTGYIQESFL